MNRIVLKIGLIISGLSIMGYGIGYLIGSGFINAQERKIYKETKILNNLVKEYDQIREELRVASVELDESILESKELIDEMYYGKKPTKLYLVRVDDKESH